MRVGHSTSSDRQQTACLQNLLRDQNVLRQVTAQGVAHGDLLHSPGAVAVPLPVIDRGMIDGWLHDIALANPESVLQARSHLDDRH